MPSTNKKEGIDVSVTLKLSDRDAKLAAEVLFEAARGDENLRWVRLESKVGRNWKEEAFRLSAAFQTAYEANVR